MKIANHILSILAACTFDGPRLFLPVGKLDRADYVAVNKVLEANGGKWNKAAKAHVFPGESAEDAVEQALATGEFRHVKQDLGQFDTPQNVGARVIELARIVPGMLVLEPSAGIGNLAVPAIEAGAIVHTCEIDPRRATALTMRIAKLSAPTAENCMGRFCDFLSVQPNSEPAFDLVVMNPPFAPAQADIDHVMHALKFLKTGGRLVSVMSSGTRWRENRKATEFRDHLIGEIGSGLGRYSFEDLPAGAFASSGTNVNAVILTVDI